MGGYFYKPDSSRQNLEKKNSIVLIFVGDRLKKFSVINSNSVHNNFFQNQPTLFYSQISAISTKKF
jgi:hypothetical protein